MVLFNSDLHFTASLLEFLVVFCPFFHATLMTHTVHSALAYLHMMFQSSMFFPCLFGQLICFITARVFFNINGHFVNRLRAV